MKVPTNEFTVTQDDHIPLSNPQPLVTGESGTSSWPAVAVAAGLINVSGYLTNCLLTARFKGIPL